MGTFQDVRYGFRMLRKSPAFAAAAVLTLALGIGANTAVFSVVKSVLLDPLPFRDSSRLVEIGQRLDSTGEQTDWSNCGSIADWRAESRSFEQMGMYRYALLNATGNGMPEALYGVQTSPSLLPILGVSPARGRFFSEDEGQPGREREILLSDSLWRRKYRADPWLVGKTVELNNQAYLVTGIMPAGFNFPLKLAVKVRLATTQMQYWTPLPLDRSKPRNSLNCVAIARLKPNVTSSQANAEIGGIVTALARRYPKTDSGYRVKVISLREQMTGNMRQALWILLGAVVLVLLIACANLANLMLTRVASRRREVAVRNALGASRCRTVRQWITESALLAALGSLAGIALAAGLLRILPALAPQMIPGLEQSRIDAGVLAFTVAVSAVAALLFGSLPALQSTRVDMQETLKEASPNTAGAVKGTRKILVVAEITIAITLTTVAGLMVKSFVRVVNVDPGYRTDHVLAGVVVLPNNAQYSTREARILFWHGVLQRLRELPGVTSAAVSSAVPLSGQDNGAAVKVREHPVQPGQEPIAEFRVVTPGYLETMGTPLIRGRLFDDHDDTQSENVALVSSYTAHALWPGEDAIGKQLSIEDKNGQPVWRQVVGVVANTHHTTLEDTIPPEVYVPLDQREGWANFVVVRTTVPPEQLERHLREAVAAVDPDQPVFLAASLQEWLSDTLARRRFSMSLLSGFGGLALAIAAIGIYGVVSFSVAQRTREIGVRMAVGATPDDVRRMVLREGLLLGCIAALVGAAASLALGPVVRNMLYNVSPADMTVLLGAAGLLLAIELAASYLPARAATQVDPMVALRHE